MTVWFVVAIPPLIMFFALAMERLETRLRHVAIHENVAVQANEVRRAALARSRRPRQRA